MLRRGWSLAKNLMTTQPQYKGCLKKTASFARDIIEDINDELALNRFRNVLNFGD